MDTDTPEETGTTDGTESETAVLVVGAGPTGLTMAIELARRGIDYRVVEKNDSTVETSRALGVNPRTLQAFEDMGLLEDVLADGFRLTGQRIYRGDEQLLRLDTDSVRNDTHYPYLWILPQYRTERALLDRLTALGGTVEFEREVTAVEQDGDSVTVRVAHPDDEGGAEEVVRASWLVGCDGGHSTIRKSLGLEFTGETRSETFLLADVTVESDWPEREALTWFHEDGVVAALPLDGGNEWRLFAEVSGVPDAERPDPTTAGLERLLAERTGDDGSSVLAVRWFSEYTVNQRLVEHYRDGNVFLAGDAAHVHSPFGAMGMNTGIQDAYNLAWKLALVVEGRADARLLDTYEAERHPVAAAVLGSTGPSTGFITSTNPVVELLRDNVLAPIVERERVQARLLSATTQLGVDYRDGPLSRTSSASPLDALLERPSLRTLAADGWRAWHAPRAGDRVLDGPCRRPDGSETSLYAQLHGETGFTLLSFAGPDGAGRDLAARAAESVRDQFGAFVQPVLVVPDGQGAVDDPDGSTAGADVSGIPVLVDTDARLHERYGALAPVVYLVRPDQYVGFRGVPTALAPLGAYLEEAVGLDTTGEVELDTNGPVLPLGN